MDAVPAVVAVLAAICRFVVSQTGFVYRPQMTIKRGLFFVFEGGDRSGKTSQISMLEK